MYIIKYTTTDDRGVVTAHEYTGDKLVRMMNVLLQQEAKVGTGNWGREIISIKHMVEGDSIV